MTRADINTMLNTPGAEVDVGYALQALIDEGHKSILWPHDVKGIYTLAGDVTVPSPVTLISFSPCVKPYTITDDSSFLNKGAVIRKAAGADYILGREPFPAFTACFLTAGTAADHCLISKINLAAGYCLTAVFIVSCMALGVTPTPLFRWACPLFAQTMMGFII